MRKKTAKRICALSGIVVISIALAFFLGKAQANRYCNPEIGGKRLLQIVQDSPHGRMSDEDLILLLENKQEVRECILGWLRERDKPAELFYVMIMGNLERMIYKTLLESWGSDTFHSYAIRLITVMNIEDREVYKELAELQKHYEGTKYFIEEDIARALTKMQPLDNK